MKPLKPFIVIAAAAALATGMAMPAFAGVADSGTTNVTFTVTGGFLSVTPSESAVLPDTSLTTGGTSVVGSLGLTTVSDQRGGMSNWQVSAESTAFTSWYGMAPASDSVSYDSGPATTQGPPPWSLGPVVINNQGTPTTSVVLDNMMGFENTSASFTPTLTVNLPADAVAGQYSGTVTTSIV